MIDLFKNNAELRLAIAPEGTRKKVQQLKTGFYYVALGAQVPIVPVAFDFKAKAVRFGAPFMPTGNYEDDLPQLLAHFKGAIGKIPAYTFETAQSNDTPQQ
jgi:1-acyl-sn-glycerol-3-phosphate acyltransferase